MDILEQIREAKENPKTIVHGQSDDLFEIEGPLYDELYIDCAKPLNIKFSDGTEAQVAYDGEWTIRLTSAGELYENIYLSEGSDSEVYWDTLVLKEGITWMSWSQPGGKRGKVKAK